MLQTVVITLYTKYELTITYSSGDIFDKKCREKERFVVVVVALLFYVHGKHLRSCRDGQLT